MRFRLLAMLSLFLAGISTAHASADEQWCRNGLFPTDPPFTLGRIDGSGKAMFNDDLDGCPWQGNACATRRYVVPGDVVIINRTRDGYSCAFYPSKGGGTAGWIESKRIQLLPGDTSPAEGAWLGQWSSEGNPQVTIVSAVGALKVTGDAYWPGPAGSTDYPTVNVGQIDGPLIRNGNRALYDDGSGCTVAFTLLGQFLIAGDNLGCGGLNVSFSGVYLRVG